MVQCEWVIHAQLTIGRSSTSSNSATRSIQNMRWFTSFPAAYVEFIAVKRRTLCRYSMTMATLFGMARSLECKDQAVLLQRLYETAQKYACAVMLQIYQCDHLIRWLLSLFASLISSRVDRDRSSRGIRRHTPLLLRDPSNSGTGSSL